MVNVDLDLVSVVCRTCGTVFWMADVLYQQRYEDGQSFYCPNGHALHYGPGEIARLRQQVERLRGTNVSLSDQLASATKSNAALRGANTRLSRINKGVCPHCKRHFADVAQHMSTQHPEVVDGST